jgi:S1-C subfamily serine protease
METETPARPRRRFLPIAAALVASAALGGAGAAAIVTALDERDDDATPAAATTQPTTTPAGAVATADLDVAELYEQAAPSVVEIEVGGDAEPGFSPDERTSGGSGFVFDEAGHIITNAHVVAGALDVRVRFADGRVVDGNVVGTDPSTDVAVISVEAPDGELTPLELGSSADVRPGQPVVALGSPLGFEGSVTAGIVSGVDRTIRAPDNATITGAIQTDAALNSGNSGGPLLDASGKVIGVNAQVRSPTIGFAIPIDTVRDVAQRLIADGEIERGFLGVRAQTVTEPAVDELGLPRGAQIVAVEDDTPAARANLSPGDDTEMVDGQEFTRDGDVIVAVDGETVEGAEELQSAIGNHEPGDRVTLTISRSGEERRVTVTLAERGS